MVRALLEQKGGDFERGSSSNTWGLRLLDCTCNHDCFSTPKIALGPLTQFFTLPYTALPEDA